MFALLVKWRFLGCLVLLPVARWQADALHAHIDLVEDPSRDPDQAPDREAAFDVEQGGVRYRVDRCTAIACRASWSHAGPTTAAACCTDAGTII